MRLEELLGRFEQDGVVRDDQIDAVVDGLADHVLRDREARHEALGGRRRVADEQPDVVPLGGGGGRGEAVQVRGKRGDGRHGGELREVRTIVDESGA